MIRRASAVQRAQRRPRRPAFVPDQLVVRVREDAVRGLPPLRRGARAAASRSLRLPARLEAPLDALRRERAIREVRPVFSSVTRGRAVRGAGSAVAAAFATSVHDSENEALQGINVLQLSKSADLEAIRATLEATPGIQYAHRVPARWPTGGASGRRPLSASNDPLANRQWGLRAIRWFQARPLPDARTVKVAVLDTGVDAGHPDLSVARYNHDGTSANDIVGHGTHVSGIIDAVANNRVGISGVCDAALHVWKIFGDEPYRGDHYVDEVLYQRALNDALTQGAQVVNLSIGGSEFSRTEGMLIRRLVDSGCVVVAAMGNEYEAGNPTEYPGAHKGVIAVGAVDEVSRRATFSNTGRHIHLVAPGVNILSTLPRRTYGYREEADTHYNAWDGTSMATPHVTAACALILARHPGWTPAQVARRLAASAARVPAMRTTRKSRAYGHGLLDLAAALA
jgi:subtilisin family serine protease